MTRKVNRITVTLSLAVGLILALATAASAHQGTIQIACPTPTAQGAVTFNWTSFPTNSRAYSEVNVDQQLVGGGIVPVNGSASSTVRFTIPADGRAYTVVAYTDWQADGGGRASRTVTCTLPVPPIPPAPPTPPTPPVVPPTPPVPPTPESECHLGTVCCPVCVTRRQRDIVIGSTRVSSRTEKTTTYERVRSGSIRVIEPRPAVMEANRIKYGVAFDPVGHSVTRPFRRRADGRLTVHINQAGLLAVRGMYFNASLRLVTVTGKVRHERRNWRLCMIADGELDVPSNRLRD